MALKRFCLVLFAGFLVVGLILGWSQLTSGFKISKIIYRNYNEIFYENRFERGDLSELTGILNQKFHFLGKGCQIYAFESEDGQYVLKLLKLHRYKIPFRKILLSSYVKKDLKLMQLNQKKRLKETFSHYKLAMDLLKYETALIYAHFDRSVVLPKVQLKDQLGRLFLVDLNNTFLLIQKKAEDFKDRLNLYRKNHQLAEAKLLVDRSVEHLKRRLDYKIFDSDHPGYVRNLGFIGEKAISIDVGNFKQRKEASREEIEREYFDCLKRLEKWTQKTYPEIALYIQKKYQGAMQ